MTLPTCNSPLAVVWQPVVAWSWSLATMQKSIYLHWYICSLCIRQMARESHRGPRIRGHHILWASVNTISDCDWCASTMYVHGHRIVFCIQNISQEQWMRDSKHWWLGQTIHQCSVWCSGYSSVGDHHSLKIAASTILCHLKTVASLLIEIMMWVLLGLDT